MPHSIARTDVQHAALRLRVTNTGGLLRETGDGSAERIGFGAVPGPVQPRNCIAFGPAPSRAPWSSSSQPASLFFFQAEDGIRAGTVTGVQTCALPISKGRHTYVRLSGPHVAELLERLSGFGAPAEPSSLNAVRERRRLAAARTCYDHLAGRSEERRVGKECRSGGAG